MTKEKNYFIREDGMIGYYSYYVQSLLDKIAELEKDFREYREEFGGYYIKYSDMRTALNQALAKCFELQGQVEALESALHGSCGTCVHDNTATDNEERFFDFCKLGNGKCKKGECWSFAYDRFAKAGEQNG